MLARSKDLSKLFDDSTESFNEDDNSLVKVSDLSSLGKTSLKIA